MTCQQLNYLVWNHGKVVRGLYPPNRWSAPRNHPRRGSVVRAARTAAISKLLQWLDRAPPSHPVKPNPKPVDSRAQGCFYYTWGESDARAAHPSIIPRRLFLNIQSGVNG